MHDPRRSVEAMYALSCVLLGAAFAGLWDCLTVLLRRDRMGK